MLRWVERGWRLATLLNFLVFLQQGRFRSLLERLLGIRAVFPHATGVRQVSAPAAGHGGYGKGKNSPHEVKISSIGLIGTMPGTFHRLYSVTMSRLCGSCLPKLSSLWCPERPHTTKIFGFWQNAHLAFAIQLFLHRSALRSWTENCCGTDLR